MEALAQYITPTLLLPLLTLVAVFLFYGYYRSVTAPTQGSLEWIHYRENRPFLSFSGVCHPMTRRDALPLFLLTLVYAVTAFWSLGSFAAPQSFQTFTGQRTVEFSLEEESTLSKVAYYPGLNTGSYTLEYSADGLSWTGLPKLDQSYGDLFRWMFTEPEGGPVRARHFRLSASSGGLELGELALLGESGLLSPSVNGARALFDEQETVPDEYTYFNSTYFDEIYHPRTAYEHIRGIYPYEVSHPPLGKLIIGLGIRVFGMTPFGWRFTGVAFGIAMLPLLYVFIKNLFGKTVLAICGTSLFAFDFMHLTQTRLATIDTYGVFFILAMYFFFYRWLSLPADAPFWRGALPFFMSGLLFGAGAASKWTVFYGGAGLAVLFFAHLTLRLRSHGARGGPPFAPWAVKTVLLALFSFVLVPSVIYCLSYLPYQQAAGETGLRSLLKIVWDNQKFMLSYHRGVTAEHPYSSRWYQWIFDIRPILYYRGDVTPGGLRSAFAAFNNPVLSWAGLLSIVTLAGRAVSRRCGIALFLLVGYLAQLLPWTPISRPLFAYHYFPSAIFLALGICYMMNEIMDRPRASWRLPVYGITALNAGLYVLFYPFLTGLTVPVWYTTHILKWMPSWPL